MKRTLPAATLILGILIAIWPHAAVAQFSDTWEFLKAVDQADYAEMRNRLSKGANINGHNGDGLSAVVIAADKRDARLLEFLIAQGASVDRATLNTDETALMRAADRGAIEVVRLLLDNGASVNLEDRRGETALMKSARARKRSVVALLLEYGADVDLTDYTGKTALAYAREARARSVERLLVDAGARF